MSLFRNLTLAMMPLPRLATATRYQAYLCFILASTSSACGTGGEKDGLAAVPSSSPDATAPGSASINVAPASTAGGSSLAPTTTPAPGTGNLPPSPSGGIVSPGSASTPVTPPSQPANTTATPPSGSTPSSPVSPIAPAAPPDSGAPATPSEDAAAPPPSSSGTDASIVVPADTPSFLLGADISSIPEAVDNGATFVDTDGQSKSMIALLQNHGFNAVRLRTFVDPKAEYGYAQGTGGTCAKSEAYNDAAHTAEFGAEVKAAGMQLLVDFHYSDTWADPGKQIIPEAWRNASTIEELSDHVRSYTVEVLEQLVAAGARPDMVQVGNETTPGMLIHIPSSETDCWGNNSSVRPGITGQASNQNWDNLAILLKAGIEGVRAVDPSIEVVLHIENTDDLAAVRWWVDSAVSRGVEFDILGLSAYTAFQGEPSVWRATLETMASEFPALDFMLVEYNPERTQANRIVHELPDGRGRGTFFWEPSQSGSWGESMFTQSGNIFTARPDDFAEYDILRAEFDL